ncbi:Uncharacterized protein QTN25_009692 [Entamoeba marina]
MNTILLFVLLCGCFAYNNTCDEMIESPDDEDLSIIELGIIDRCITQHGKITVRYLRGAITEIYLGPHIFPVESTANFYEISVLEGYYNLKVVKRVNQICYYRQFEVTIESLDYCSPFFVYTVKKDDLVFQNDSSTSESS